MGFNHHVKSNIYKNTLVANSVYNVQQVVFEFSPPSPMEDILIQYNESLKNSYQYFRPKRIDFQDSFAVNFEKINCEKIFHCLDVYHNDGEENLLPVLGHIPPTEGRPFSPAACHNTAQLKMVYMACGGLSIFCIILALVVYLAIPKLFNLHGKVVLHIQNFKLLGLNY